MLLERPEERPRFARYRQQTAHVRDLLVCTHGTHDGCCATFGYPVYCLLRHEHAPATDGQLRVWRVSHFGGHRFAPTLIDLPEGRYWGRLDAEAVARPVRRDGALSDLRRHYRGWSGLGSFFEALVEGAIFEREGWAWTSYLVSGEIDGVCKPGLYLVFDEADYRADVRVKSKGTCDQEGFDDVNLYHVTRLVNTARTPGPPPAVGAAGASVLP